jgi:N4-gp56 family major capsid protein
MALTTTTEIAGPVNVVFQVNLLRRASALLPYFSGTMPASIAQHQGTFTAKWRRYDNLTAVTTPLAELTGSVSLPTRTGVQPSITDLTATVQKFGNYFILNEEVDLINFNGQAEELSSVLGHNAGTSLNRLQRNEMEDNATILLAGGATTATDLSATGNSFISPTEIARAVNDLNNQDAMKFVPMTEGSRSIGTSPIRSAYWGITHVDVEEDIRTLTGFNPVETYASQTKTAPGEFGSVGGVRFIATTESSVDAGGAASATASATGDARTTSGGRGDIYNTVIYGMESVGSLGLGFEHVKSSYMAGDRVPGVQMISHPRGSAGAGDPLNEVATIGWKSWHAAKVLNSNWIRTLRHTTSRLA